MTIAFFIDEFLPKLHGPVTSTLAYKKALEDMGHTVYIVAPAEPGYKDEDPHIIRIPSFDPRILKSTYRPPVLYPGQANKLAKYKFDIVHSQTQMFIALLALETARVLKVPHVSTLHTLYAELVDQYKIDVYLGVAIFSLVYPVYFRSMPKFDWRMGEGSAERLRIKDQAWRAGNVFFDNTNGVIAPSAHIARTLKKYGLKQKCHILPNGVDVAQLRELAKKPLPKDIPPKGKDIWLVCVSRLSPEKRQRALIEAMASVKTPNVKLLLVGPGPSEDELRQLVAEKGLIEKVYILGRREPDTIPSIMAHSDMFALASYRFDNQPMVILEALATGLPIIYCDDNLTEGLTKKNALLTKSPSPESIAEAIDALAKDSKKRKAMAKASSDLSASFDIKILAKKLEAIYNQAIEDRSKKPKKRNFLHRLVRRG